MKQANLPIGSVVQISPDACQDFGGCLMIVTEVKPWGVHGYCTAPASKGRIVYRAKWESIEPVGMAAWGAV